MFRSCGIEIGASVLITETSGGQDEVEDAYGRMMKCIIDDSNSLFNYLFNLSLTLCHALL
jgi:hypothetical protein